MGVRPISIWSCVEGLDQLSPTFSVMPGKKDSQGFTVHLNLTFENRGTHTLPSRGTHILYDRSPLS